MTISYPITLEAARTVAESHREKWLQEKAALDEAVAYASATKTSLPDGYWQAEHRAHGLYHSALMLVEVLEE